jgi:3-hydroxy acid dehydrogenase/malonic semialdehyde reductase
MKNKTVFITGASAGIGKACAEVFAEAGSNLILTARRISMINEIAKTLEEKHGIEAFTFKCDVRNREEVEEKLGSLPEKWKKIDVLINNAGLASGLEKVHEGDYKDWDQMIDTNVKGLLYVSRVVVPWMVENGNGHIINNGSIAGVEVYPNGNVYCATKSAVKAISKGMAIDLNGTGIRVTNVDPGLVETEFALVRFHGDKERAANTYKGYTPLKAKDIADVCLFAATRPKHVMIQDILITPTDQATATIVNKKLF